jgi:hypothetical protein
MHRSARSEGATDGSIAVSVCGKPIVANGATMRPVGVSSYGYALVGYAKLSWLEMVGNTIGIAPATPRLTASMSAGTLQRQGL